MLARNIEGERDPDLQSKASMANSDAGTSSGNARGGKYQVFLNFCGRDTRKGFTSVLHRDLRKNGIHAFIDNEELQVGEEIGGALLEAIDDSQIYIPIFSRNYASSKWCLRELARMVDNTSKSEEKKILPIFYDVEPDDVDLKNSVYRTAIKKHKEEHEKKQQEKFPHEVESWEEALKKVGKIKGWVLQKTEADLVDSVVDEVLQELKIRYKSVTKDLVGLNGRVAEVMKWFDGNCSDEVRFLGLHGMGGIGKTTLARVIYNELSSHFGKCCTFLDDVRETLKKEGLLWLQKKLLIEIDSSRVAEMINDVDYGRVMIGKTLGSKKVLIVLDDVEEKEQIENLIGQGGMHPKTRIIITTRNKSVLEFVEQRMAREMKEMDSDHALPILPYEMKEMNFADALQLFKRHAYVDDYEAKNFDSLSRDIVKSTGGLPLALEVIGALLFRKPKAKWEDTLNRLKKMPHERVREKLAISYEALTCPQREIFLDVACFFINEDMMNAKYMWEACEFYPNSEIDVLVEMSLIRIKDNKFGMHDQLRDLGRAIVHGESGNHSRLWTSNEFFERNEDVEALDLQGTNISISHEEIGRFKSLRFLRLSNGAFVGDFIARLSKLRWISWRSPPPYVSVPNMHSKNLIVLELFDNHFTDDLKVWDLIKMATNLKSLALVKCHCLTRTPDLSGCLTLERLTFDDCGSLKEIDSSITKLTRLLDLNIIRCMHVRQVPDEIGQLVKLKHFSLNRCYKVHGLPTSIGNLASLRKLDLSDTGIGSLPDSIGKLSRLSDLNLGALQIPEIPNTFEGLVELQHLRFEGKLTDSIGKLKSLRILNSLHGRYGHHRGDIYPDSWELPKAIRMLDKLEELNLGGHSKLVGEIPNEIGSLSSLRVLNLYSTKISRVPGTINMLSCLSTLDLRWCDEIIELPELPASLVCLKVYSCSLQMVPNLSKLTNLVELELSSGSYGQRSSNLKHKCDLRWIGKLSKLKELSLCLLNVAAPPNELGSLSLLEKLTLHCLDLQLLERLPPSLLSLELDDFSSTGPPQSNLEIPSNLKLCFSRLQEIQLYGFSRLQHLHVDHCDLQSLSIPSSVRTLRVSECPNMFEIQFLGSSASLEELSMDRCDSIGRMVLCGEGGSLGALDQSESSSRGSTYRSRGVLLLPNALKKLKRLELYCCQDLLEIQVISTLLSLQDISIYIGSNMEKFTGVSNLKNLHRLVISGFHELPVVEGLDKLEFLTFLDVEGGRSLETLLDIPNSKIPDECLIEVSRCKVPLDSSSRDCHIPFKHYKKMMAQRRAPQPETNKEEAKMEGDAIEPNTKLLPLFHSSAISWDHEISKEPLFDNVREGTPREKQNQTTEQDSNPLSLDEFAPPKTLSDRFKTCLVGILECVCNRDFP